MPWPSNLCQCWLLQPSLSQVLAVHWLREPPELQRYHELHNSPLQWQCYGIMHVLPLQTIYTAIRSFSLLHFILRHSNVFWNRLWIHLIDGVRFWANGCKGFVVQQHPICLGSWALSELSFVFAKVAFITLLVQGKT